jgi:hypothetical protein
MPTDSDLHIILKVTEQITLLKMSLDSLIVTKADQRRIHKQILALAQELEHSLKLRETERQSKPPDPAYLNCYLART